MRIKIRFKTPTINHLYGQRGSMRFLTKEAKELKEKIKEIVIDASSKDIDGWDKIKAEIPLRVHVFIYENWYCKNGSVKRVDIANREKFLIDSVFDALGIDDKFIFSHTMTKLNSVNEYALIEISVL